MSPTAIEWTNETWNPTTGCDRVSPGCARCYAMTLAKRLKGMGSPRYQKDGGRASGPGFGLTLHPDTLDKPFTWKKPRLVFVDSMSDLFHDDVPDDFIDRVFAVMALTPQHTYQVLTKRPERMRHYMIALMDRLQIGAPSFVTPHYDVAKATKHGMVPLPNVWLGVTVENQRWADERIPILLDTPAAVRFVSAEPLLGPVDFTGDFAVYSEAGWVAREETGYFEPHVWALGKDGISWVIVGGESGPRHRPFNPDWARSIVAQCQEAGVACFVKQLGGLRPGNRLEDLPEDLRVREYPA